MKRFYWGIILFVLPIVVFFWGAELALRSQPNIYKYKKAWMDQHAEEVETLIIGRNSIAFWDYREDERFVETDFNDRMHLTVSGAKKFSGILARDLKIRK